MPKREEIYFLALRLPKVSLGLFYFVEKINFDPSQKSPVLKPGMNDMLFFLLRRKPRTLVRGASLVLTKKRNGLLGDTDCIDVKA